VNKVRSELDRAVIGLGVLALAVAAASAVGGELNFRIRGVGLVVTLALGGLAIAAGWLALRPLALLAGIGFLAAAAVQIIQLGGEAGAVEHGVLGGNASTFAVWLGLGAGLIAVGAQSRLTGTGRG
jgi:hypothetical protein